MRYTKIAVIALSLVIVITAFTAVNAQDGKYEKSTLSITGQGKTTLSPDKATISIAVETMSDKASDAVKDNSEKTNKVIEVIKSSLGKNDKVSTAGYSLSPVYEYSSETKKSEFKGYRAANHIIVETRDLKGLGQLIDSTAEAGANKIDSLTFDSTQREQYKKEALELAVKDAKSTAETVAGAAGVKLVKILSIRPVYDIPIPVYRDYELRSKMAVAESSPTPIEPGELTVNASVTMVFEIE